MKKLLVVALVLIAAISGGYLYQKYRVAPDIKFDTLELTDLNGQPVKLQDYKGKKLFLNFFATWCGPCVGEFPELDHAADVLMPDNFTFISISDEPLPLLNHFSARINTPHIIILHSVKKLHALGVFTVPTSYLLNANGKIVFHKVEEAHWGDAEIINELKLKAD